jgi:hypothetical protein
MSETHQPDALRNLVKFVICLAILGTIVSLAWYFVVALPLQQATILHTPTNVFPYIGV